MKTRCLLVCCLLVGAQAGLAQTVTAPSQFRGFIAYKTLTFFATDTGTDSVIEVYYPDGTFGTIYDEANSGPPALKSTYYPPLPNVGTYSYQFASGSRGTLTKLSPPNRADLPLVFSAPNRATSQDGYYAVTYIESSKREELINTSNRSHISAGKSSIAGFVITGARSRWVLMRVIGPGLKAFGVPDFLADPKLELFGPGGLYHAETGWRAMAANPHQQEALISVTAYLGAFPLSTDSDDAVYFALLAPGVYSVVGRSAGGTGAGEVLTEVYVLP